MRRAPIESNTRRYSYFWAVILIQTGFFTGLSALSAYIGYGLAILVPTGYTPKQSPDDIAKIAAPTACIATFLLSVPLGWLSQNTAKTRLKENIRNFSVLAGVTTFLFPTLVGTYEGIINKQSVEESTFISASVFTGMLILMTLFVTMLGVGYKCKNCIYTESEIPNDIPRIELSDAATEMSPANNETRMVPIPRSAVGSPTTLVPRVRSVRLLAAEIGTMEAAFNPLDPEANLNRAVTIRRTHGRSNTYSG